VKPIVFNKFEGSQKLQDNSIRFLYNYLVTRDRRLRKVPKFEIFQAFYKSHSLFTFGDYLFFIARANATDNDSLFLYNLVTNQQQHLRSLSSKDKPVFYTVLDDSTFFIGNTDFLSVFIDNSFNELGNGLPPCDNLVIYQARLMGNRDNTLLFTFPFKYLESGDTAFDGTTNSIIFDDTITNLYVLATGLLVTTTHDVSLLSDEFPLPKRTILAQEGVLSNTISSFYYKDTEFLVWSSPTGLRIYNGQQVMLVSDNKIDFQASGRGAVFSVPELDLTGVGLQQVGFGDQMDAVIIRNGKLI
jgi:hypothetical protein